MSTGPIATASVKIVPDLSGFQALLQAEVNKAVKAIKVPVIKAQVSAAGVAGSTAARNAAGGSAGGTISKATKDIEGTTKASNALRGSLIGLSRVTPVTIFGLGLYGTAAAGAGLAIKSAISATADFEKQLNTLQAVTRISDQELEAVRSTALALGGDVTLAAISASDAAVALTELAKAGLSIKDSLDAARGVLELAGAAEISAGEAARFVATELNAFGLAGDQALRVVDLLASASIAAQGEIRDFGNAFQQVGAVAAQAGLSVEQTTAALTLLAKAGITSADAGTSLRTFLLRLIPTTKQASQFVRALGVTLDESKTEGEQLSSVIEQYRAALLLLNPVQRTNVLNQIFGQDAIRAGSVLLTQNVDALRRQIDELDNAGVAAELNAAKAKGLSGAWAGLQSNLQTLGIQLGSVVDGPLEGFVRSISDTIIKSQRLAGRVKDLGEAISQLRPVKVEIDFILAVTDKIPDPVKKGIKELALFSNPITRTVAFIDLIDGLTGGGPDKAGAAPDISRPGGVNKLDDKFGLGSLLKGVTRAREDEFDRTFGAAARANKDSQKALRKKIQKLIDEQAGGSIDSPNIVAPRGLRNAQLEAQLNDNLQAELAADKAIENSFKKRLEKAKGRPVLYNAILQALVQAHAATQSVLSQIASQNAQAQQERQQAITDAISLRRTRLENAAELANNQGEAERKLIAFYLAESKDLRLEASARLAYEAAYNQEIKAQQQAIVAQAKAEIDLRNSRLDLAIQRADLTPGLGDNRRAINAKIKRLQQDLKDLDRIKNLTLEQQQKVVDLKSAIVALQLQLKNLSGQDGGFSINDLFKEAVNNFTTFGSNIASRSGVLSPQDARGQVSKGILGNLGSINSQQLTVAQQQLATLLVISEKIGGGGGKNGAPAVAGKGKRGNLLDIYGAEIAAAYNYGAN